MRRNDALRDHAAFDHVLKQRVLILVEPELCRLLIDEAMVLPVAIEYLISVSPVRAILLPVYGAVVDGHGHAKSPDCTRPTATAPQNPALLVSDRMQLRRLGEALRLHKRTAGYATSADRLGIGSS